MKKILLSSICVSMLAACGSNDPAVEKSAENQQTTESSESAMHVEPKSSGIELANFDKTARPQDDFYRYINGTWLDNTEIPADRSNYGSFTALCRFCHNDA